MTVCVPLRTQIIPSLFTILPHTTYTISVSERVLLRMSEVRLAFRNFIENSAALPVHKRYMPAIRIRRNIFTPLRA
jgi:hypothetical protein